MLLQMIDNIENFDLCFIRSAFMMIMLFIESEKKCRKVKL